MEKKKLSQLVLNNSRVLSKEDLKNLKGGSFPCYCNGQYVGMVNTIEDCWNRC